MFKLDLSNSINNMLYCDYMNKQEQKKNDNEKQKNNIEIEQTTTTP